MDRVFMKSRYVLIAALLFSLAGVVSSSAYGQKKPKITKVKPEKKKTDANAGSAEPDKVLYDRAVGSVKHGRYTEARLDFQTLINTYPDSEYLAKAKLGVADSYYKEGGTSNLTQAVEEYKNFIVFFPFLDEAAYAQMQVAMAHYRMTEKSDRDNSQAEAAEDEFRAFILKYPQSALVPQAEQYLRNIQEILADGEFKIARFYYVKQDYRASAARLVEVSGRYPLYSQSDLALSMLGNIYLRAKQVSKNEDDKNHWADLAGRCYDRILRDYPLSKLAPEAKARLTAMGMPIPAADPGALARMQKEALYEKQHHPNFAINVPMNMIRSSPDVSAAAHSGEPNLNPPDDTVSATEVLTQGARGPSFSVVSTTSGAGGGGGAGGGAPTADTESVGASDSEPATATGAQVLNAPAAGGESTEVPAAPAEVPANPPAANAAVESSAAPAASLSPNFTAAAVTSSSTAPSGTTAPQAPQTGTTANSQSSTQAAPAPSDPKTESTSKKKKGLHKLIPF
jgi:outer membrane protein assembly factor BamD